MREAVEMDSYYRFLSRVVFAVAVALLGLAIAERVAGALGYTFMRGGFTGGRLLEIAAILMIFGIALLLRQIRDLLRARSG
jgi:hypothetical protein